MGDDLRDFGSEDETIGSLVCPTLHGGFRGRAVEGAVYLDRIKVLSVVAQEVGGLGTLGVEAAFPSGSGEGGGADVERGHDFDILPSNPNPS